MIIDSHCHLDYEPLVNNIDQVLLNAKNNTVFYVVDENKKIILDFFTINEIINHFGKNNTYWLHILGSGTLTRNIENQYGYLDTVTANGNIADFYFSTYSINDSVIISFIRKALIEPFIDEIEDQKIQLLNISIGNFLISFSNSGSPYSFNASNTCVTIAGIAAPR